MERWREERVKENWKNEKEEKNIGREVIKGERQTDKVNSIKWKNKRETDREREDYIKNIKR